MKHMRMWFPGLLCAVLFLCLLMPGALAADGRTVVDTGKCGATATWTLYSDGELTITGSGRAYDCDISGVPWGNYRSQITSVTATGVSYIGKLSFRGFVDKSGVDYRYINLRSVTIGSGVQTIGDDAFSWCPSLQNVTFGSDLVTIGDFAFFDNNSLTSVTIPSTVQHVCKGAFGNCDHLQYVTVGSQAIWNMAFDACDIRELVLLHGVNNIRSNAFRNNTHLEKITLTRSVTDIEDYAFVGDDSIRRVYYYGTAESRQAMSVGYLQGSLCDVYTNWVYVKDGTTVVDTGEAGLHATWTLFSDGELSIVGIGNTYYYEEGKTQPWGNHRSEITSVTVSGVSNVGPNLFYGTVSNGVDSRYVNLRSVTFGSSVEAIWKKAFAGCPALQRITFGSNVVTVGEEAFRDNAGLITLTIPSTVDTVSEQAFAGCYGLQYVTLGCRTVGAQAFDSCNIRHLTLLEGVETVGTGAFRNNTLMESVTLPHSLTGIGNYGFYYDVNISRVYYHGTAAERQTLKSNSGPVQSGVFSTDTKWVYVMHDWPCGDNATLIIDADGALYVTGSGAMTDYNDVSEMPWYQYRNDIREIYVDNGIEKIGNSTLRGCTGVKAVILGGDLKEIGRYAFANCGMEQITLGTGLSKIGVGAFSYCNDLKVVFYRGTESGWSTLEQQIAANNSWLVNARRYYHGTVWKTLTLPDGTTQIGAEAFVNTGADIIVIPRECESIAADAFDNCASLGIIVNLSDAEITAPAKVLVLKRMPPAFCVRRGSRGRSAEGVPGGDRPKGFQGASGKPPGSNIKPPGSNIKEVVMQEQSPLIILCSFSSEEGERVSFEAKKLLPDTPFRLSTFTVKDWNASYSPWPAPNPMSAPDPFQGLAQTTLQNLLQQFPLSTHTYLAGYSLAGLFSLWSMYQTPAFSGCACCSGSLWFEGWDTYAATHPVLNSHARIYLSLGGKEEHTSNPTLARIGDCTRRQEALLKRSDISVRLEMNPGGHFADSAKRLAKGIAWLLTR